MEANRRVQKRLWILENPPLFAFNEKVKFKIYFPEERIVYGICKDEWVVDPAFRMRGYSRYYNVEYKNQFKVVTETDMFKINKNDIE